MRHLKVPLIATAIMIGLLLLIGIGSISLIYSSDGSSRQKAERAGKLGGGVAILGCMAIAPFWLYAAAKIGKERRQKRA